MSLLEIWTAVFAALSLFDLAAIGVLLIAYIREL